MHQLQTLTDATAGVRITIIRKADVARRLGISIATLDRLRGGDPTFPKAVQLGIQSIGWIASELDTWLAARPRVTMH